MDVISLSVDEDTLEKMDALLADAGFDGRSELVRTAVKRLYGDQQDLSDLSGQVNAVIIARHGHRGEGDVADISHRHDAVINTQLHCSLAGDHCLEVFHVAGDADAVTALHDELQGSRGTETVDILPQ